MTAPLPAAEEDRQPPTMTVVRGQHHLHYVTPNKTCAWRVKTLATKEPSTIAWLDSLAPGAPLLDVGANVGMYSIYAAVVRRSQVFAFEPESQNYALLCQNIVLNKVSERVLAWPAALSDRAGFDRLYLSAFEPGGSCHAFGEARDPFLKPMRSPFVQGSFATTIDSLVAAGTLPVPAAIKIDVDGFEHRVIVGASRTLQEPGLASLLIEINPQLAEHRWVVEHLGELGFGYDPAQVAAAVRKQGHFEGVAEYVFRRR
jgi:FkbM family methyltransferase